MARTTAMLLALGLGGTAVAQEAPDLPSLAIDRDAISVMGVSSGGYMATQLATAFPERFSGLAAFAAGPWGCAQGSLRLALGQCMGTRLGLPSVPELLNRHDRYLAEGLVGNRDDLARQRVYLWHGQADEVVAPELGELLAEQYREWLASPEQLRVEHTSDVAHGWPVGGTGLTHITDLADCQRGGSPHLLACDLDGAGKALNWLYGDLDAPEPASEASLKSFDQSAFHTGRAFDEQGYLYVPQACETGESCGLVVALHGCNMSHEQIDTSFVRHSGLNEWAESNRLVVLYPQAAPSLPNPQACWDWWGFEESTWQPSPTHDTRQGRQVNAIAAMVEELIKPDDAPRE
ncbi:MULTISPECIES: PHB depolymerase family esterase [Halomonadaceae]|uniref:extracellular catalytic domain type 2 short-chain-length polyhydroxyalkanoate depolymerase n=1 Tax=Halomonadaceae TaxID=28256 RepID=UPI00159A4741|nr:MULTISPECIES: PHB depolymerase family esterase [Halomonas]QJQ95472.1 poly(3-hydroxybutyrate) depolymerase [Halomonas sp. PA5]